MILWRLFLFLCLFFSVLQAGAQKKCQKTKALPGLFISKTTYQDEGRRVDKYGNAVGIQKGDRYFLLTNSHLSQGEDLEFLDLNECPVNFEIKGHYAKNDLTDLALIEIKTADTAPFLPLFVYHDDVNGRSRIITHATALQKWQDNRQCGLSEKWTYLISDHGNCLKRVSSDPALHTFLMVAPHNLERVRPILLNEQLSSARSSYHPLSNLSRTQLVSVYRDWRPVSLGLEYMSLLEVKPGVSGSPVLERIYFFNKHSQQYETGYELVALFKRFRAKFRSSFYASLPEILNLFSEYDRQFSSQGPRWHAPSDTSWHIHKGHFYRKMGDTLEFDPTSAPAGGSLGGEGGGSLGGEGGYSGKESSHFLSHMKYEGQPTIGFVSRDDEFPVYLYADISALNYIKYYGGSPIVLDENLDLVQQLRHRLGLSTGSHTFRTSDGIHNDTCKEIVIHDSTIQLSLGLLHKNHLGQIVETDKIVVELDSKGRQVIDDGDGGKQLRWPKQKFFAPLIEVQSQKGQTYDLSLLGLFFDHPIAFEVTPDSNNLPHRFLFTRLRKVSDERRGGPSHPEYRIVWDQTLPNIYQMCPR